MRESRHQQLPLTPVPIDHIHARELEHISKKLDALPESAELVRQDLLGKRRGNTGRKGMSGEQVLRALLVKQMNRFTYEELSFHVMDSISYRRFCRLGLDDTPSASTLKRNCKKVRPETLEAINMMVVRHAASEGIEKGRKIRADCTVVDSTIHHPTDSSLLWDCVRVLARNLRRARELTTFHFSDHRRRAKKRMLAISTAKRMEHRTPLYRDLIDVTPWTVDYGAAALEALKAFKAPDLKTALLADGIVATLSHFIPLVERVIGQTQRRVIQGEKVASSEKVVSIFEEHTDIIVKGRRETRYGHNVCLTAGASGMITDYTIETGNPADVTLTKKVIERQIEIFGEASSASLF